MNGLLSSFTAMPWWLATFLVVSSVFFLVLIFLDTIRGVNQEAGSLLGAKQMFCIFISFFAVLSLFSFLGKPDFLFVILSMVIAWGGSLTVFSFLSNMPMSLHPTVSLFMVFWFVVLIDALTRSFLLGNIASVLMINLLLIRLLFITKAKFVGMRMIATYLSVIVSAAVMGVLSEKMIPLIIAVTSMAVIFHFQAEND